MANGVGKTLCFVAMLASAIAPAGAQTVATRLDQSGPVLPANTLVYVSLNSDLTTKHSHEGDAFDVTVSRPVIVDGYVVIPQGTLGHGHISWRTGKGAFGKSGKMEFDLTDLEIGSRRVPIKGHYRLEGDGNGGAAVGALAAGALVGAGIVGAFVTGKSANVAQGTEYRAFTQGPVEFAAADTASRQVIDRSANADPRLAGRRAAELALAATGVGVQR